MATALNNDRMKRLLAIFLLFSIITHAQQPVTVTVTMIPPVSPYLGQMLSPAGGRFMVQVLYSAQPGTSIQVKLAGRLERISPSPLSIELSPSFVPAIPLTLQSGIPMMLNNTNIQQSFGNLNENNLVFTGTSPSQLKEGVNYKLPEGIYRLCLVAYSYGQGSVPLSNPAAGCASFSVCYKASAPQLVQPVNGTVVISSIPKIQPASPMVFSWTAPTSTCGLMTSSIEYELDIRRVFPGQTPIDALNNPYVFQKKSLPSPTFLLDTVLYKNVLQRGQQYVVRVRAASRPGGTPIDIDNGGYSRPQSFFYGDTTSAPALPVTTSVTTPVSASTASCGLSLPSNTSPIASTSINGMDLLMGGFALHVENANRNGDGSYSGSGTIDWKPAPSLAMPLKLAIAFSDIKVNTDKIVFAGTAATTMQASKPAWQTIAQSKDVNELLSKLSPTLAKEVSQFASDIQPISKLAGLSKVEMPIGLGNITGSKAITMAITRIVFTPTGSDMSLVHSFNITEAGPAAWLSLAGTGFCIKPDGFNFSKGVLYMPTDRTVNLGLGGESMKLTLKGAAGAPADVSGGTWLTFTNAGIEKITALAELELPRSLVLPEKEGKVVAGNLSASFKLEFTDWEDWTAEGKLNAFQLAGLGGLSFLPSSIVYDHSQKANPAGIIFPPGYTGNTSTAFDGLYINKLQVTLPPGFGTFGSSKPVSFSANHLLIDETGINTQLKASNIVSLSTGSLGGWNFSISAFELLMINSSLRSGSVDGEVLLPVSSTALAYNASLMKVSEEAAFEFTVKPKAEMKMDMLLASLHLHSSSLFKLKTEPSGVSIFTSLNGAVSINTGSSGAIAALLPELSFNNMVLANRHPVTKANEFYFNADTWSLSSPPKTVGGFPVKLNKVSPYLKPGGGASVIAGLQFDINIDIGFGDKTMISGVTTLDISGKISTPSGSSPKASFNELLVKKIKLQGDVGPISIAGMLEFYKRDAVFGDGIKGQVSADFRIAKVEGTAQFGKTTSGDAFPYWFVDARASFPKPVPLVGPLGIAGFGGGAFYNMSFTNDLPGASSLGSSTVSLSDATPGKTASGLKFIPQRGKAGMRATIIAALTEPKTFNGDVTLTAVIDMDKGSFSKFGLSGNAFFVTDYPSNKNPFVKATVDAAYDIPSTTFSLAATVDAKFASVTARVPIGVYADPSKWFVKVGDPFGERVSFTFLDVSNSVLTAKLNANAYLAAGNVLDGGLPPLPAEISSMSGMPASNPQTAALISDINSKPGGGLALGAQVNGDFRASFLMLYAQAKAILGFDLMLKHFTEPIECGGARGGINDWYAIGQLYAYLAADVGVHVDVWFYEGDLSLCSVEAGALLNGGLPNPTWAEGRFAVKGSVLGGAVKVSTNFEFRMGDKCYPGPSDPLKDIKIIQEYGPAKADVFDEAYVVANQPLGEVMEISVSPTADKPAGETRQYRFSLQSFTVSLDGKTLPDEGIRYSPDGTVAMKRHNSIYDPNKTYYAKVVCIAEQWYPSEGRWDHPYNDKTKKREAHSELTEFSFKTGDAPAVIPEKNVVFSYPLNGQRYVLKNELKGQLQLKMWQPNILSSQKLVNWQLLFVDLNKGDTIRSSFTPDAASNSINFSLPSALKNATRYRIIFWPKPQDIGIRNNAMASIIKESTRTLGSSGEITIRQRTAGVSQPKPFEQPVYSYVFATSQYNTLSEKLTATGNWKAEPSSRGIIARNSAGVNEPFDEAEVIGFTSSSGQAHPSLLQVQIGWDNAKQNDAFAKDKMYANAFVLTISGARISMGAPEVRREIYRPVNTVDWSRLNHTQLINTGTGMTMQKADVKFASAPTPSVNMNQFASSPAIALSPVTPVNLALNKASHAVSWTREYFLQQDYNLLKTFAQKILAFQSSYQKMQSTLLAATLEDDESPQLFTSNSIGGNAYIPLNKLGAIYTSTVNMSIIKTLASMPFQSLPKSGTRNLQFTYGNKAVGQVTYSTTLNLQ